MKRLLSLLLAFLLLLGTAAAGSESSGDVLSFDFDLRFHLDTSLYSFRDRRHLQGYADLLDSLRFRGNVSWCPSSESMDLHLDLIPVTNPDAAVSVRMYGLPSMIRVSSSLLGGESVCFNPPGLMYFAKRAGDAFNLPLPYLALLVPDTTVTAFRCLFDTWNAGIGSLPSGEDTVPFSVLEEIAEGWRRDLESNSYLRTWMAGVTGSLLNPDLVDYQLKRLPDLLLKTAGGEPLTVKSAPGSVRWVTAGGNVLWSQRESGGALDCVLNLPESGELYLPAFSLHRATGDSGLSLAVRAAWNRTAVSGEDPEILPDSALIGLEDDLPDSLLQAAFTAENLPESLPADSAFSGSVSAGGYMLPAFSFRFTGSTGADGQVRFSLAPADPPEAGEIFSCTGSILPAAEKEPFAFTEEEVTAQYNLFGLNDQSLHDLIAAIDRPLILGLINFLYELPASSCQSVMDDLEDFGILQTVLK